MKRLLSLIKSKKGMALATVISVFAAVAVLGTVTATVAVAQTTSAKKAEGVTAAQYLARSAVDLVSTQLENKLAEVDAARSALLNALPDEKSAALSAYEAAKTALSATGLIPSSYSSPVAVIVNGILSDPVTVYISRVAKGGTDYLEVVCTLTYNGSEGSARARVASIAQESSSIVISSYTEGEFFWSGDVIYTWGDATFEKVPIVTDGGAITAGGTVTGYPYGISGVKKSMPILTPPSSAMSVNKTSSAKKTQMISGGSIYLTPADSGYYGALTCSKSFVWNVDTTSGDVVLIFDSILAKNQCEINVRYGQNMLYIYIIESSSYTASQAPQSSSLLYFMNQLDIIGIDSTGRPQTYIIAYNDNLQQYYQTHNSNLIPEDEVPYSPLDEVYIKNGPRLDAYFYLPCSNITFWNNSTITGAVYASDLYAKNNTVITFRPLPENDLFDGFIVVSTTPTDEVIEYIAFNFGKNRVWLD